MSGMRVGILVVLVAVVLASCSGDSSDNGSGTRVVGPADIADLADGEAVVTEGVLVITDQTRLCETILQSFPPQCAGAFVVLGDLQPDQVVDLRTATDSQGITTSWTAYPYVVSGTVDGGILVDVEGFDRVYPAVGSGMRVRLLPAQSPIFPTQLRSGELIWWAVDVTNLTDQSIPLTFGSGQVADVTLSQGDTVVYRWSDDRIFTQEINEVSFAGGDTAGATLNGDFSVPPGTYTMRAFITAVGAEDVVVEAPVEVIAP